VAGNDQLGFVFLAVVLGCFTRRAREPANAGDAAMLRRME